MTLNSSPVLISLLDSLGAIRHPFVPISSVALYSRYSRGNIPLERTEWVNIDFITKLPTSEAGYNAVVTIINCLTKRACWIPVKEAELTTEKFTTAFIDGYVWSLGLPVSIVSDRNTQFTSSFWQSLCSQLGIKLRMSTAHHPQSDGQVERRMPLWNCFGRYIYRNSNPPSSGAGCYHWWSSLTTWLSTRL